MKKTGKKGFFSFYGKSIYTNIYFSNYIINNNKNGVSFNFTGISSDISSNLKTNFAYLFMLLKKLPYVKRTYKSEVTKFLSKSETKYTPVLLFLNKHKSDELLKILFKKFIPLQLPTQNRVINIKKNSVNFLIWNAPLTKTTNWVQQTNNSFIDNVSLTVNIETKTQNFDLNIFFLRFFKLISKYEFL